LRNILDERNNEDFDETRRCLLNSYNSYVQNHAGYMIAFIIGFLALMSNFRSFFEAGPLWILLFCLLIVAVLGVSFYTILRITFWSSFANNAISMSQDYMISILMDANEPEQFFKEAPFTSILQAAIWQQLITHVNGCYYILALRTRDGILAVWSIRPWERERRAREIIAAKKKEGKKP
jgi:hypothetical protein